MQQFHNQYGVPREINGTALSLLPKQLPILLHVDIGNKVSINA